MIVSKMKTEDPTTVYLKNYEAPHFEIKTIDLVFDLQSQYTLVTNKMKIAKKSDSSCLFLNGESLELVSIKLNDISMPQSEFEIMKNGLKILNLPQHAVIEIVTKIFPDKNTALMGLYVSRNTYCTQCEAEGFRRITYFLDRPDVLAKYTTTIQADRKQYPILLSNGNLVATGDLPDGRHFAKWEDPFKKPSYLFALVAGDFDLLQDTFTTQSGRVIDLRIYVEKGFGDGAHHAMSSVKDAFTWDEKTYGREYDLDIYMIVAISDFNMGAMENKGLNIFNTKYVLAKPNTATDDDYMNIASVVAHEYFHNWSGNRVTCRDWFQLSLKEGLTIFRDQSFSEGMFSHAVMRIRDVMELREAQFPEDMGPLAHAVQPDSYIEINNFYTSTIYNKGAEVLRMLQTILGKETFRKAMDLYFDRYDGKAATIEDYVSVMEEVSGIDLKQFRRWYYQAGTPQVIVTDQYNPKEKIYSLTFTQHCDKTPNQPIKLPFYMPVRMGLLDQHGASLIDETVLHFTEEKQTFTFSHIQSRPIPSLFRHFSAPIKLSYHDMDHDWMVLAKHDTDAFNKFEALQQLMLKWILKLVETHQKGHVLSLEKEVIELYRYLLTHETKDLFFLSEMLSVPSEKYIGEQMSVIDVDAIHAAREFILNELATHLSALFLAHYHRLNHAKPYQFDLISIGERQLKNKCLSYLLLLKEHQSLGVAQFKQSLNKNMTDTMTPFAGLVNIDIPAREAVLSDFFEMAKQDALMVDKWLSVQAACKLPTTLDTVKALMQHPAFDIKNPNKVYALIGTFGARNAINFHAKNGEGYVFLREVVEKLDKINAQVAARMVKPLTTWNRYDKERQALMLQELLKLKQLNLSPDLFELVNKSLNERT